MNRSFLLCSLIFIVIRTIESILPEYCEFQHPFQFVKTPKCDPYDYCLTFDEQRWKIIQYSTKTAYPINEKPLDRNDFEVKGERYRFDV